ncbi:MAG: hypothetical protein WBB85_08220, partial [Albidovulum sp.]|uniref:hypothetical protein n=1 Tax=Albidovulum sp. TaxID=1872424 RepID=UPI003CAB942A
AALRDKAKALAPDGFATKLILPADQILYTDVEAPGPDNASRRTQIRAALEGRTPYAVDDLAFDWSHGGQTVPVAVVARITLTEAEDFAESHGFNPVAFVAMPDPGQFAGEPFFGQTGTAHVHLPAATTLTRDQEPVRIVDAPIPEAPAKTPTDTSPDAAEMSAPETDMVGADEVAADDSAASLAEAPTAQSGIVSDVIVPDIENVESAPREIAPPVAMPPAPHADDDASPHGPGITDRLVPEAGDDLLEIDYQVADFSDPMADDLARDLGPEPGAADAEAPFIAVDDLPDFDDVSDPGPEIATPPAFSSQRTVPATPPRDEKQVQQGPARPVSSGITQPTLPEATDGDEKPQVRHHPQGRIPPGKSPIPGAQRGTDAQLRAERLPAKPAGTAQKNTAFPSATQEPRARRTRLGLGLLLVALLVLFMIAVALWSLFFAAAPVAEDETVVATAPETPAATPETAPAETEAPIAEPVPAAAPEEPADPPAAEPASLDPPAAGTIWSDISAGTSLPAADATAAPIISDAAPPELDATATAPLTAPTASATDAALPLQPLPPPFGTEFEFRSDGLIKATEDGVVTPDGITLIAGQPPVIPAPRPAEIAPAEAEAPVLDAPVENGTTAPETALPDDNDASAAPPAEDGPETAVAAAAGEDPLPSPVDPAHAARKPRARPAAIVAATEARVAREAAEAEALAQAIASATPQAVATSQRPKARPKGLARVVATPQVDDAVAAAMASSIAATVPTPAPAAAPNPPEEIDEPEPVAATPNIPTSTTVAKQATVANAINLRDVNLIGIYGSSSSRRALVRMGNGRYVKVKIGDRLDGGQVAAIGDRELSYIKRGKTIVLKIEG